MIISTLVRTFWTSLVEYEHSMYQILFYQLLVEACWRSGVTCCTKQTLQSEALPPLGVVVDLFMLFWGLLCWEFIIGDTRKEYWSSFPLLSSVAVSIQDCDSGHWPIDTHSAQHLNGSTTKCIICKLLEPSSTQLLTVASHNPDRGANERYTLLRDDPWTGGPKECLTFILVCKLKN